MIPAPGFQKLYKNKKVTTERERGKRRRRGKEEEKVLDAVALGRRGEEVKEFIILTDSGGKITRRTTLSRLRKEGEERREKEGE